MAEIEGIATIGDIPRHYGRMTPEKTAIVFEGERISWSSLDRHANRIANRLIEAGLAPGDHVAHFGKNTAAYFALLFGVAKAGGVLVGINWRLTPEELAYIVADSEARFLFADEGLTDIADHARTGLAKLETIVALNGRALGWPALADWLSAASDRDPDIAVAPSDVLFQMYTSGTTGRPKGAEITHEAVLIPRRMDALIPDRDWHRWTGEEVQLVQAPVFHLTGNVWAMIGLYVGATIVVHRDFDIERIFADIAGERISHAIFVPAMLGAMLQHPALGKTDFSSLKTIYYGASPIPLALLQRAVAVFRADFVQLYGMTEISGSATYLPPSDHDPSADNPRMRSAGKPFPWAEIRILDAEGRDVPAGSVGEVAIRAQTIMKGYWKRPEATAEVLRDGWFLTGDAGYLDGDGYLYIHDRVKDMIISGGENIYPAEVESCLYAHPDVLDVAVIGVPSEKWGEDVKALVVRRPGAELDADTLIAHARTHIAAYKCPRSVDFVDSLPRNASGKILKRELRKRYWQGRDRLVG